MNGLTRFDFLKSLGGSAAVACLGGCVLPGWTRRKLALNASTLRPYGLTLGEQVRAAVAGGFAGFEPWMKDVRAAKAAGRLGDVIAFARDNGLSFVNGIAFGEWTNPDPARRAAGLDETRRDMELLAEMGCPCIAASMFGIQKPGSPILSEDEIAERFRKVCELGDASGVRPLLEYWGHSVNLNTLEGAMRVAEKSGRADAGILADVYHTYRGGSRFASFARLRADQLPVLHVNDYPLDRPRPSLVDADRVWPGDGGAPWRYLFDALDSIGAEPWLSVELFNAGYCRTSPRETARTGVARFDGLREKNRLGLAVQMWSVNDIWKKDPAGAFRRLRKCGYTGVQASGFYTMDWNELARMLDGEGLKLIDMSFTEKRLATDGDFKRFVEFCRRFGVDFAFYPHVRPNATDAEWREKIAFIASVAPRLRAAGIRCGFHNHQIEFTRRLADGSRPIDLIERTGVDFEFDVGHAKLAGEDPVGWLQRLPGRIPSIHAKPAGGLSVGGAGDANDWRAILAEAAAGGARWAVVECETRRNTFEDAEESAAYLKEII